MVLHACMNLRKLTFLRQIHSAKLSKAQTKIYCLQAMQLEMKAFAENETWNSIERPKDVINVMIT